MCESLGFAHPRHLLKHMNARDIAEWRAFYRVRAARQEEERRKAEHEAKANKLAKDAAQGRL